MIRQHTRRAPSRVIAVATGCTVLLELVVPLAVLQTYDRFIPNGSTASLAVLLGVAAACLVAEYMLRQSRAVLLNLRGTSFAHQAGCHVMGELLRGGFGEAPGPRTGENLALLATVRGMREMTSGQWMSSLAELLLVPLSLALIALIAGPLVLVPLVLIAAFAASSWFAGRKLAADRAARQDSDALRMNAMVEMFQGFPTVKALSIEQIMRRRYETVKYGSTLAHMNVMRRMTGLFDATTAFGTLLVMSLIMAGAFLTVTGQITAGAMIASVILSGRTMAPIQKGLSLINRRQEFLIEKRQVDAMLEARGSSLPVPAQREPANEGRLALRGVSLSRPTGTRGERVVLGGATLELAPREMTLVDAGNHADLETLYRMLAGVLPPRSGALELNGVPMVQVPEHVRTRQVACLQGSAALYRGTIMDNISRFGTVSISDVLFIARHLRLDEDLSVLPRGYDTFLRGDGGDPIPPGLRQRIAMARALAPRPRLILFNHADTGLDQRSYTALFELFARLRGHATLVVSTSDGNLRGLARHRWLLGNGNFTASAVASGQKIEVAQYRELRV